MSGDLTILLRRTFTMEFEGERLRFWRVIAPIGHPNYGSDLSLQGLRDWGIL